MRVLLQSLQVTANGLPEESQVCCHSQLPLHVQRFVLGSGWLLCMHLSHKCEVDHP